MLNASVPGGDVLRDQLLFMQRCGFDSFEVANDEALESWRRATGEITVRYQPAADRRPWVSALRHRTKPAEADRIPAVAVRAKPERQPCTADLIY